MWHSEKNYGTAGCRNPFFPVRPVMYVPCGLRKDESHELFRLIFVQWYTWFLLFSVVLCHRLYPFVPIVVLNSYSAMSSLMTGPCTVAVVSSGYMFE